ncbi:MAG TPA: DUF3293 domain-containing protein [Terriglobia bacterium]|nr:DUF3293 domain-containing protein [Terriglobia bacterium]
MTAIDAALIAAYQATDYVVFEDDAETVLRIGELNPAVDALLKRHGAEQAAVITAWNPASVILSDQENEARETVLWRWIGDHQRFALAAEGRDRSGKWRPEQSCLIFDITADQAEALGREFGQNAIVHLRLGEAPRLLLLR